MPSTRQRGSHWERAAEDLLRGHGLRALTRNFSSRFGELDLVMLDGPVLVFVEVRYRHADRFGSGADTVDRAKQRKLASAAGHYLGLHAEHRCRPCRFDVVSIGGGAGDDPGDAQLNWIKDAFDAD
jgi:putative endonuclease